MKLAVQKKSFWPQILYKSRDPRKKTASLSNRRRDPIFWSSVLPAVKVPPIRPIWHLRLCALKNQLDPAHG